MKIPQQDRNIADRITAYDDDEKYQKAVEFGSDDYFTKPIDFPTLKKKMFGT